MNTDRMLNVGIYISTKWEKIPPRGVANGLFKNAKANNINLFYFYSEDINKQTKTINGHFFDDDGKLYHKEVEYPDVIDNHGQILRTRYKDLYDCAKQTRPKYYPSKSEKYDLFMAETTDTRIKNMMIPLSLCETFADFESALEKYGDNVVFKPNKGFKGRGVVKLTKKDDSFYVSTDERKKKFDYDGWKKYYEDNIAGKLYVMQPYFGSVTPEGAPFHIRILAKKGVNGVPLTSMYSRMGKTKGLTSNGLNAENIDIFLKREFPETASQIKHDLDNIAKDFPKLLDDLFDNNLFDMGIDVGIEHKDGTYKIGIFEVNTASVGTPDFLADFNTEASFGYYRHLASTEGACK